jgi:hypothetical protein
MQNLAQQVQTKTPDTKPPASVSMLIRSIAFNEDSRADKSAKRDEDEVTLNQSETKFLKKVRAEGGDFSRIFMRMQERSKRMQSQL